MSKDQITKPEGSTEEQILEAARKVFTRKGYAAARMDDIAKEAGMNRALLHYYFRSKERLFDMVFEENIRMFYGTFIGILNTPAPLEIRLRNLVSAEIDLLMHNQDIPLFVMNEINRDPELLQGRISLLPVREFMMAMTATLKTEMDKGTIRRIEPMHVFMHLMSLCVFPFVAKPMLKAVTGATQEHFEALMEQRKQVITETLLQLLKPRS